MTMIKVTTTTMTTRVTTMITTTTKTLAELDSKMQYFAALHDCSCLLFQKNLKVCTKFGEVSSMKILELIN